MSRAAVEKVLDDLEKLGKLDRPRRRGRKNITFDCPFHSKGKRQETPSFGVEAETGEWNCFNPSCGRRGPTVQVLYAYLTGTAEAEVEAIFPQDFGATDDLRRKLSSGEDLSPRPMAPYPATIDISDSPEARAYMERRRIPRAIWERLGLRYCPAERIRSSFDDNNTVGGRRIIFPIKLPGGRFGFMGRSIGEDRVPKWRPISNTFGVFYDPLGMLDPSPVMGNDCAVLVEGEFDLAACVREGLPVISCLGARLGIERAPLLEKFNRVMLLFDGNKAGREGRARAVYECGRLLGHRLCWFDIPEGYDPGSLPLNFGAAIKARLAHRPSFSDTLKGRLHG